MNSVARLVTQYIMLQNIFKGYLKWSTKILFCKTACQTNTYYYNNYCFYLSFEVNLNILSNHIFQ